MGTFTNAATVSEVHGTRQEVVSFGALTASVTLQCAWLDRWTVANDLVANARAYPANPYAKCRSAAIRPLASETTTNEQNLVYTDALVTASYSTDDGTGATDAVSESIEPTAEFLTLDYRLFKWSDGTPLKEGEAPGKLIRGLEYKRTVYDQTTVPSSILTNVGCVNSNTVTASVLGWSFAAGTLLFKAPTLSRTIDSNGQGKWTINYAYSYRPNGWNKFWKSDTGTWATIQVLRTGSDYNNFPSVAF